MEELKDIPRQQGGQYGARYKKRRRRPDIKAIAIFILLITVVILAANVIRLSNALKDDEQYISAQSSRVFEYYGEKDVIKLDDPTLPPLPMCPATRWIMTRWRQKTAISTTTKTASA